MDYLHPKLANTIVLHLVSALTHSLCCSNLVTGKFVNMQKFNSQAIFPESRVKYYKSNLRKRQAIDTQDNTSPDLAHITTQAVSKFPSMILFVVVSFAILTIILGIYFFLKEAQANSNKNKKGTKLKESTLISTSSNKNAKLPNMNSQSQSLPAEISTNSSSRTNKSSILSSSKSKQSQVATIPKEIDATSTIKSTFTNAGLTSVHQPSTTVQPANVSSNLGTSNMVTEKFKSNKTVSSNINEPTVSKGMPSNAAVSSNITPANLNKSSTAIASIVSKKETLPVSNLATSTTSSSNLAVKKNSSNVESKIK